MSCRQFGPHEPGELAGDRGGDGGLGLFAGGQMTQPSTQPQLRSPRPGGHGRVDALLAAAQGACVEIDTSRRLRARQWRT